MIRTEDATVKRLAGGKGVVVTEVVTLNDGRTFDEYFTVWLGDGHGLAVGDRARFLGRFSKKVTEKGDKTFVDVNLNDAKVVDGTLVKAAPAADGWGADSGEVVWH
ncbi:hypothetical protein [Herbiconiux sp.]|uniref:hypothetical protein n=1 Tax=Herbiconiux sp. TaxID=1871186 RepID=UPI0025BB91A0|nr:hypothetical protein [Herbiconiux sp.]